MKYFWTGRVMKIKIDNNYSETQNIPSGVPEVSVLGPLLFLIYMVHSISFQAFFVQAFKIVVDS